MDAFGGEGMQLSELFTKCLTRRYVDTSGKVSYAIESEGQTTYLYFEASNGLADWKRNLCFPAKAYSGMNGVWYAHYGFLSAWKAVEPIIEARLEREKPSAIVSVGYSQGAAIATLCHEYLYYRRTVPHTSLIGYGFAAPRVLWGRVDEERWKGFTVIRNLDDLVTHLPPRTLGFRHVGRMLEIGERGRYGRLEAHSPEAMLRELVRYEKGKQQGGLANN
jgi:hypothetical protein